MQNTNSKLNTALLIILIIIVVVGIYLFVTKKDQNIQYRTVSDQENVSMSGQQEVPTGPFINTSDYIPPAPTNSSLGSDTQGMKTYTNTKYGFSFQYPATWTRSSDIESTGTLSDFLEVSFQDPASTLKPTLLIHYTVGGNAGAVLFNSLLTDFNASQGWYISGKSQSTIASSIALKAVMLITKDGRGNNITPGMYRQIVDFLDPAGKRNMELQFTVTSDHASTGASVFQSILDSFKFL